MIRTLNKMGKLFLTSFEFKTGENTYKEYRLVVDESIDGAYDKAQAWFAHEYPESELLSCIAHHAIEHYKGSGQTNDDRSERERVIDWLINDIDPNTSNGSIILSYLKRNRTRQVD